ncbi:hypothetical protein [Propionivibrio sp.]|uniref:hypothetical protein n=1 Tax=Propionivibrio sp. TaxID=2212460 RepID=UPI003BF32398
MNINFKAASRPPRGVLARILTIIVGLLVLATAFMFSLVFFAVVAVAGLVFWLYFWWKTRALRKQIREQINAQMGAQANQHQASEPGSGGEIIEGEAVRVVEERGRLSE